MLVATALLAGCPLGLDFDTLERPTDDAAADADATDIAVPDSDGADTGRQDVDDPTDTTDAEPGDADAMNDATDTDVAPTDASDTAPTDTDDRDTVDEDASPDANPADTGPDADDAGAVDADADDADADDADAGDADAGDVGPPPLCGNGMLDPGEACDDGDANADAPDTCRTDCMLPRCGDGLVDDGEACDDGNLVPGDACDDTCQWGMLGVCETCTRDEECADGLVCATRFEGGRCMQPCDRLADCPSGGLAMDCNDVRGVPGEICVPVDGCEDWCVDADDDGFFVGTAAGCEPQDCDDTREGVRPDRAEDCTDPGDRDCDGFAGCDDADCADRFLCRFRRERCDDDEDNDGDGPIDCEDDDCAGYEGCVVPTCADARPLTLDGPPGIVYTCREPDRHRPLPLGGCEATDAAASEAVFFVDTDVAGRLTVDVRDADSRAAVNARVYVRAGRCEDPSGQLACNEGLPCAEADDLPGLCLDGVQPRHARVSVDVPAGRVWVFVEALDTGRLPRPFECGRVDVAAIFVAAE